MPLYTIAGLTVLAQPRSFLTKHRFARYLCQTDETPDIRLTDEGTDANEYMRLARAFYTQLLRFDGFLLHASAVELNGYAYLFSAPSGTGKSTHAALWKKQFGATVINDDKPAIRLIADTFYACGTPFSGKTPQNENRLVKLGGIAFLERAEQDSLAPLAPRDALWGLLDQTLRPTDAALYTRLLALLEQLLNTVPFYRLRCTPTDAAAIVSRTGMEIIGGTNNGGSDGM